MTRVKNVVGLTEAEKKSAKNLSQRAQKFTPTKIQQGLGQKCDFECLSVC